MIITFDSNKHSASFEYENEDEMRAILEFAADYATFSLKKTSETYFSHPKENSYLAPRDCV